MPEQPPDFPPDANELHERWKKANQYAREMNQRAIDGAIDVAKEKTQYFEKIALAAGGTIALVVSFVGAHADKKLQPQWLLRSAFVTLALTMIAAMFRNWRYPFYVMNTHGRQELAARLDRERTKCALLKVAHTYDLDCLPTDVPAYLAEFAAEEKKGRKEARAVAKRRGRGIQASAGRGIRHASADARSNGHADSAGVAQFL
jgi:hypothetical protein